MGDRKMNREELIDSLRERVAELEAELAVSDILLIERQKLLSAIPGCDSHGECVPHAQEWIEKAIAAFGAELVIEPDRALGVESLCLCDNHISLDMVSGGAAKYGYLGEVTLSVDGEYVRYSRMESSSPPAKQSVVVPEGWQPIETAPKNNEKPLLLAYISESGELSAVDFDGIWQAESESWEIPEVYYYWASANGLVDEPTHWAYQPEWFDRKVSKQIEAEDKA